MKKIPMLYYIIIINVIYFIVIDVIDVIDKDKKHEKEKVEYSYTISEPEKIINYLIMDAFNTNERVSKFEYFMSEIDFSDGGDCVFYTRNREGMSTIIYTRTEIKELIESKYPHRKTLGKMLQFFIDQSRQNYRMKGFNR